MEINKCNLYQRHLVIYFFYPIASGRTSAMKSEDNDRLQKVAENVTALDKRMVIKFCANFKCKFSIELNAPSRYLAAFDVLQKLKYLEY